MNFVRHACTPLCMYVMVGDEKSACRVWCKGGRGRGRSKGGRWREGAVPDDLRLWTEGSHQTVRFVMRQARRQPTHAEFDLHLASPCLLVVHSACMCAPLRAFVHICMLLVPGGAHHAVAQGGITRSAATQPAGRCCQARGRGGCAKLASKTL